MAGPWERYADAPEPQAGPWARYAAPAAEETPPGGSWLGRRARDVIEGLAAFPSAALDAMFPGQAVARDMIPPEVPAWARGGSVADAARGFANALSLPTPSTQGQRNESALYQGAISAIPTLGMGAPLTQIASGAAAGLVGEASGSPWAGLLAGLGVGGVRAAGGAAANRLYRVREPFAGRPAPIQDETGAAVPTQQGYTAGQQRIAAERLQESASDPRGAAAALENPTQIVDGSIPTTAQQSGDMGLLELERAMQTRRPGPFAERRGEQAVARDSALESLGGQGDPGDVAAVFRNRLRDIERQGDADLVAARLRAGEAEGALPGGNSSPEVAGTRLRNMAAEAEDRTRTAERALWSAIDPNGTLTIDVTPVQQAADVVLRRMTPSHGTMSGAEEAAFGAALNYPGVIPLSELLALRSNVRAQMRAELAGPGRTPTYSRLSELNDAITDGMATAVARQEAISRATGAPRGTFDANAQARTDAANAATRDRAARFNEGSDFVNGVLTPGRQRGTYRTLDSAVPESVVVPGQTGGQRLDAYLAAVGDNPGALAAVDDAAALLARRAAINPDGTLNPGKLAAWTRRHQDFLRRRPELARALEDAGRAEEAVTGALARRTDTLRAAQTEEAARLMNLTDPADVGRTIAGMMNSPSGASQMRALHNQVAGDPNAVAGVRRALADYIRERFVSTTEAGNSGAMNISRDAFQKWAARNRDSLGRFFTPHEIRTLDALVADLQRANRSITAARIPGQSNTAQDMHATGQDITRAQTFLHSLFNRLGSARFSGTASGGGAGATLGFAMGGPGGALLGAGGGLVAGIGADMFRALRAGGYARVDDLVTEAMLNPALARVLLMRATTPAQEARAVRALRFALTRSGLGAAMQQSDRNDRRNPPPGSPRNALASGG